MVVRFDALSRLELPTLTLCNPGCKFRGGLLTNPVGELPRTEAEEFTYHFNASSELNLRIYCQGAEDPVINAHMAKVYNAIQNKRLIYASDVGFFVISNVRADEADGMKYKDVQAKSCDTEIAQKKVPFIADGTYRFDEVLNTVMSVVPLWTVAHIDEAVAERWRTFENVDATMNCLGFMLQNMQDAYSCIFLFDILNRTVSVYDQAGYIRQTNIHLSPDGLINSLQTDESEEDIYTALSVTGVDDIGIGPVNPLGTNVVYDFGFYLDWMTPELQQKVSQWQEDVSNSREQYQSLSRSFYTVQTAMSNAQMEVERLNTLLSVYRRCRENIVAESGTDQAAAYNEAIAATGGTQVDMSAEIEEVLAQIDGLISQAELSRNHAKSTLSSKTAEAESLNGQINAICDTLRIPAYFTSEEYDELSNYIFEGDYSDEYIAFADHMSTIQQFEQMVLLYERGMTALGKVSHPTREYQVDTESFLFAQCFQPWSEQLETGCLINVELDEDDVAQLFLCTMRVNYEERSMGLTFGNRYNKYDTKSLFENALGQISKSANSIGGLKELVKPIKNGMLTDMDMALRDARNLTMADALAAKNEAFVIDGSGCTGRKVLPDGSFDPCQVKLTSNALVFTKDNWQTCDVALGKIRFADGTEAYGLNAELIMAQDIIMTGSFTTFVEAFMEPGEEEAQKILKASVGLIDIPDDEIALYDFDGDGTLTYQDALIAMRACSGLDTLSNWSGAQKSTITMKINMRDPNSFITTEGTNMWGRTVTRKFGINMSADIHPILSAIYPVGSVYTTISETDTPDDIFGGIWKTIEDSNVSGVVMWERIA